MYSVILFHSTNHAIWTAKLLKKKGLPHVMIPVPRHLSSDCGYCVRINEENVREIEETLKSSGVEYESIQPF
ncbi:MAG TPA: DUF3343 domain-containing protein [Spirochaetota bacterium]|nr:DUF3343 domain-containing protein [Spirochaetota bacterium]HPC39583.1 DUF3343 domain-containing protein [Spirochaetota bacterium]HPL18825.1 DUF3343 domain-containing protein [Spirochaetota bacterium]HQF09478.1 DUF3343 domain-containing protein [Spirochaetota bacterium]HQH98161.1 DUF3343 domain-containing protein [Spirochaetota bacterium]